MVTERVQPSAERGVIGDGGLAVSNSWSVASPDADPGASRRVVIEKLYDASASKPSTDWEIAAGERA